ncbi:hypothetical protein [Burkholderia ubonensis]|uniref:hypothetical protein n=1 Tax=Burkholderia ubonensis TaxID=101571 RepID=UPI0012FBBE08|nr:hypothetical protein [Burkholderia ubonensis]
MEDGLPQGGALHYRAARASGKTLLGKLRALQFVMRLDNGLNRSCCRVMTLRGGGHGSGNGNGYRPVWDVHRQHGAVFLPAWPLTAKSAEFRKPAIQTAGFLLSDCLRIASVCMHLSNILPNALAQ